jgi:hypothetical protein
MERAQIAVELDVTSWEQWIGANLRAAHFRGLLASARRRRGRARARPVRPVRPSLLRMLAICIFAYGLLQ